MIVSNNFFSHREYARKTWLVGLMVGLGTDQCIHVRICSFFRNTGCISCNIFAGYFMKFVNIEIFSKEQRLGRQNRHMGLWPPAFKSYGPFLKSMGHGSNGMVQKLKKRNIGVSVRDVTFDSVYHTASCSYRIYSPISRSRL